MAFYNIVFDSPRVLIHSLIHPSNKYLVQRCASMVPGASWVYGVHKESIPVLMELCAFCDVLIKLHLLTYSCPMVADRVHVLNWTLL